MTHRWSGWPGAWCLDCGIEDPGEACMASNPACVCAEGPPEDGVTKPCIAPRTPCAYPNEGRADPYRQATWAAWYDKEGDAAEEAGVSAICWIDDHSPDEVQVIDGMLFQIDASRLPTPVLLDILSETWPLRWRLRFRGAFVEKAIILLGTRVGTERALLLTKNRA